jgi:hypothetical protein
MDWLRLKNMLWYDKISSKIAAENKELDSPLELEIRAKSKD